MLHNNYLYIKIALERELKRERAQESMIGGAMPCLGLLRKLERNKGVSYRNQNKCLVQVPLSEPKGYSCTLEQRGKIQREYYLMDIINHSQTRVGASQYITHIFTRKMIFFIGLTLLFSVFSWPSTYLFYREINTSIMKNKANLIFLG